MYKRTLETRSKLTAKQWRVLDYLYKQGKGAWIETSLHCPAQIAKALSVHRLVKVEDKIHMRGSHKGKRIIKVRLKPTGWKLVILGPPENVIMSPGEYSWERHR